MSNNILNTQLENTYRDNWGRYLPIALERARPVLESDCHTLRYYQVPDDRQAVFTAAGEYRQVTLSLLPGSFLIGFQQQAAGGVGCLIQVTDVETRHQMFSQAWPSQWLYRDGCNYFPCPMPVIAPGVLLIEIWAQQAGECSLLLAVAELDREKAKMKGCLVK